MEVARQLALKVDPGDRALLEEVERAVEEFDEIDEAIAQGAAAGKGALEVSSLAAAHDRAYSLMTFIEARLDGHLERQHALLVSLRDEASAAQGTFRHRGQVPDCA